ncbi:hypothetical protein [Alkalicoccus halolimnae]|uniref:Uncharacterized protein n=1 Tax=Alkalicoccus halolimnae TaxID=1667239 RepID=A0A5C7F4T6_9BACI|nr:hypothetical protein [Alkalicoccus halolimnae]TXF83291.1 hypothetical protein FTX54_12995 [Alkalicoccus halolimnae]
MSWMYIILIITMMVGILLFFTGRRKGAGIYLFFGGMALITPVFISAGWFHALPLVPALSLLISFLMTKLP